MLAGSETETFTSTHRRNPRFTTWVASRYENTDWGDTSAGLCASPGAGVVVSMVDVAAVPVVVVEPGSGTETLGTDGVETVGTDTVGHTVVRTGRQSSGCDRAEGACRTPLVAKPAESAAASKPASRSRLPRGILASR